MSDAPRKRSYVVDVLGIIVLYAIAMGALVLPLKYFGLGGTPPPTTSVQAQNDEQ